MQENNFSDMDSNDGDWLPNDEENQNQDVDDDEGSDVDLDSSDEALASHSKYWLFDACAELFNLL